MAAVPPVTDIVISPSLRPQVGSIMLVSIWMESGWLTKNDNPLSGQPFASIMFKIY